MFLTTFSYNKLIKEIKAYPLVKPLTILANADTYEYALTYILSLNTDDKSIQLKLSDHPEMGEKLITQEEINGIRLFYNEFNGWQHKCIPSELVGKQTAVALLHYKVH